MTGEVDHPGQLFRDAPAVLDGLGRHVMPHMLIDPEDPHALKAGDILGGLAQQGLDRVPPHCSSCPVGGGPPSTEACLRRICSIALWHARTARRALAVATR